MLMCRRQIEMALNRPVRPTNATVARAVQALQGGGREAPRSDLEQILAIDHGPTEATQMGLWVGNGSDGDFAKLRITPANDGSRRARGVE